MTEFLSALAAVSILFPATPQSDRFVNFETPQVHPLEVAVIDGEERVLVCNTPRNSLEIRSAASPYALIGEVFVGLGPCTVRWDASLGLAFVCNFDGDSVSAVRLDDSGSSPPPPQLLWTEHVGDEPTDIAIAPDDTKCLISLSGETRCLVADISSSTFSPVNAFAVASQIPVRPVPDFFPGQHFQALKRPRNILWLSDNSILVLNAQAGGPSSGVIGGYDMGLSRLASGPPADLTASNTIPFIGGLGSTNHAMALNAAGNLLFVVGTKARNGVIQGIEAAREAPTGFVQSWLMLVDINSGVMSVRPEQVVTIAGQPATLFQSFNLNRSYRPSANEVQAVDSSLALSQPTDICLAEQEGVVTQIAITAFHSDKVALLVPDTTIGSGYRITRLTLPIRSGYSVVGPRGIVRLSSGKYVVNGRLDNSLHVVSSTGTLEASLGLSDPTPSVIRLGREFLYSARHSGNQFISCASCHIDGRTDALSWDLSDDAVGAAIADPYHDAEDPASVQTQFEPNKGLLVTQTMQGLVNSELGETVQFMATNAPYYWRGTRIENSTSSYFTRISNAFNDFASAFVELQGRTTPLNEVEMASFRKFVHTIRYPSNPEQPLDRRLTGDPFPGENDPSPTPITDPFPTGVNGSRLGLAIYHNHPADTVALNSGPFSRSCADCHHLPEGSSNTSTRPAPSIFRGIGDPVGPNTHTFETAALRDLEAREMWLHGDFSAHFGDLVPTSVPPPRPDLPQVYRVANNGLGHSGEPLFDQFDDLGPDGAQNPQNPFTAATPSINAFNQSSFGNAMLASQLEALTEYVRSFDTGMAPASGRSFNLASATAQADLELMEEQVALGNAGLVVREYSTTGSLGYWFDVTLGTPPLSFGMYRLEGTSTVLTRADLLAHLVSGTALIAQGTPQGEERRIASSTGAATPLSGASPSAVTLMPMIPNSYNRDVYRLAGLLHETITAPGTPADLVATSVWTLRTLQAGVAGSFNVPSTPRHEPPRRFRVKGSNIRHGAKLILGMTNVQLGTTVVDKLEVQLVPTWNITNNVWQLEWESVEELDAIFTYAMLNGGPLFSEVRSVLQHLIPSQPLTPALAQYRNRFKVTVKNEDGTLNSPATWQVMRIKDRR